MDLESLFDFGTYSLSDESYGSDVIYICCTTLRTVDSLQQTVKPNNDIRSLPLCLYDPMNNNRLSETAGQTSGSRINCDV